MSSHWRPFQFALTSTSSRYVQISLNIDMSVPRSPCRRLSTRRPPSWNVCAKMDPDPSNSEPRKSLDSIEHHPKPQEGPAGSSSQSTFVPCPIRHASPDPVGTSGQPILSWSCPRGCQNQLDYGSIDRWLFDSEVQTTRLDRLRVSSGYPNYN
jgi:hypothetical protein